MKQLIELVGLGAFTALSVALYDARRQTEATHHHHSEKPHRQAGPEELGVLLGLDGTVIAREINLAPRGT